jgi:hypothetical protein
MRDLDELLGALGRSKFRSRFHLSGKEAAYLKQKGIETILEHARDFISKRLAQANPVNDGQQTPMGNHPVFVAQHATGTCCRKCLAKWHSIPGGQPLTEQQIDYILKVLKQWLMNQSTRQTTFRSEKSSP